MIKSVPFCGIPFAYSWHFWPNQATLDLVFEVGLTVYWKVFFLKISGIDSLSSKYHFNERIRSKKSHTEKLEVKTFTIKKIEKSEKI